MKKLLLALALLILTTLGASAQEIEKQAPGGFDQVRNDTARVK